MLLAAVLTSLIKHLLQSDANNHIGNKDTESALHYASIFSQMEMVGHLLEAGADKEQIPSQIPSFSLVELEDSDL